MEPYRINFDGLLRSTASWAKVNRELLLGLRGHPRTKVAVQPRRGFNWDRDFTLPDSLKKSPDTLDDADFTLSFTFPPLLDRIDDGNGHHLLLSIYEATHLPSSWVEPLERFDGTILVPTRHCESIYERSGIDSEKLKRIPYGFNPEFYYPEEATRNRSEEIRIITIATPHYRKGLDCLEGVSDLAVSDNINWSVHCPYRPEKNHDFWEHPGTIDRLENEGFDLSVGTLSEQEVADRLRAADLCVQPSRSEGFGLVILESMACGTPVVTTNWGGHLDFAGEGMILIDGSRRYAGRCQYHERHPDAKIYEPDPLEFRETLRRLASKPKKLKELSQKAQDTVSGWTWEASAQRLVNYLRSRNNTKS